MRFVVWAGREVEGVQAGLRAVTETESPQAVDRENVARGVRQRLNEGAGGRIVSMDRAVTEVSYEQVAAQIAETGGREREPPRGIEGTARIHQTA